MPAQQMKLSVLIGADASGMRSGGAEAEAAIGKVKTAANDAGKSVQSLIDAQLGLNRAVGAGSLRGDDIRAYGAQLDALRAKYNPTFAVISRYKSEVDGIRKAHSVGAISIDEMTAALSRQRQAALASIAALKGQRAALPGAGFDSNVQFRRQNLGYQAFDVGQGIASGLPLPMILAQQGPQIAQAYVGNGGVKALAADARAGLSSIIGAAGAAAAAIGPIGLAFAGVSAAALAFYALTRKETKSTDEVLQEHSANIKSLADAYGIAADAAKHYSEADKRIADASARTSAAELAEKQQEEIKKLADNFGNFINPGRATGAYFQGFKALDKDMQHFGVAFDNLRKDHDVEQFVATIDAIADATGFRKQGDDVLSFAKQLGLVNDKLLEYVRLQQMLKYPNYFARTAEAAAKPQNDTANANALFDLRQQHAAALAGIGARTPEELAAAARARVMAEPLNANELYENRQYRANAAATEAQAGAENTLKRASEDRLHAADAALITARQELAIAGQSAAVQEQKKAAIEAEAQYREQIYRTGQKFNQAELDTLKKKASELVRIQQQTAITNAIQQRNDDVARLQKEVELASASTAERQKQLALFDAEREIRDRHVTDPKQAGDIRKAAVAQADLNAQIAAGNMIRQQGDNIALLQKELELATATTAERARQLALLQAEQKIKAAGITDEKQAQAIRDEAAAQADLNQKLEAANFIRQQGQDIERLRKEVELAGASPADRASQLAQFDAEQRIKQGGLGPDQAAAIRQQAAAVASLNAQLAAQNALKQQGDDIARLRLEISLVGASVEERTRSIAAYEAEKQIRDQGIDSMSREAAALRAGAQERANLQLQLERQQAAYQSLHDAESGMIDTFVNGLSTMGNSWKDTFKNMLQQGLQFFNQLAIGNPLKNALTGSNLPTLADFFSGKSTSPITSAATNTGTMTVNAATVMVNGIGAPGFTPNTNLGSFLGLQNGVRPDVVNGAVVNSPVASTVARILPAANQNLPANMSVYQRAISQIESGSYAGNYSALGPTLKSGDYAIGRYQIMASNVPSWSQKYYGQTLTPQQALANPAAQDAMFNGQFGYYLNKYGNPSDAASAWFTGGPLSRGANRADINGTTGNQYVNQFNQNVAKLGQTTSTAATQIDKMGTGAIDASKALTDGNNSLVGSIAKASQAAQQPAPGAPAASGGLPVPSVGSGTAGTGGIFSSISGILGSVMKAFTGLFSNIFSGIGNIFGSLFGGLFADGAAFSRGNVIPFATGGIVTKPTLFPMAGGRTGVMGEAGEEAIMPLHRGRGGKLGVAMTMPRQARQGGELKLNFASTHNVNVYGTTDAELKAQFDEGTRLALDERDRQWHDSLPDLMDAWRRDPNARMRSA